MNTQQSHKKILEEMSKHEPNCPQSEDIREDCTCPQQSTVEERFENFVSINDLYQRGVNIGKLKVFFDSEIQLAEQKAREEVIEKIEEYADDQEDQDIKLAIIGCKSLINK